MEIIPAILPRDFAEIEEKIELIVGLSKIVQIDICDGKFVSSTTWPYKKQDDNFEAILREERGMPEWEKIDYEFDLMVKNLTEDDARKWLSVGASRLVLHLDSTPDLLPVISVLCGLVDIGIAITVNSSIDKIEPFKDKIQYIQIMGIDRIGFQGQKFNPKVLGKIEEVKKAYPHLKIQIDGGVTFENAALLKHAGADKLVTGSALFESENIVDTLADFKAI